MLPPEAQNGVAHNHDVAVANDEVLLVWKEYFWQRKQIDLYIQGGTSGRGTLFVVIKFKILLQYLLLTLKRNFKFEVNKRLSSSTFCTMNLNSTG